MSFITDVLLACKEGFIDIDLARAYIGRHLERQEALEISMWEISMPQLDEIEEESKG